LNEQAESLYKEGKLPEAEAVLKSALAAAEREFGPDSNKEAYTLSLLATVYGNQDKYADAEPLFERALAITEKNLGPQDVFAAFILDGLGSLYTAEGKYVEGEASFKRSLAIAQKTLVPRDARIARIQTHYAQLLRKMQRVEEADALDARARSILGPSAGSSSTEATGGSAASNQLTEIEAQSAYDQGDLVTAVRLFQELAAKGNAFAQSVLGELYMHGRGVPRDPVEAVAWLRKAAAQGQVGAELNLGVSYEQGLGVPKDKAEAARWYRRAAEQGDPGAQRYLGDMYAKGTGVAKDWKEAESWYRKAAAQGDEQAASLMELPESLRPPTAKSVLELGMRAVELQDQIGLVRFAAAGKATVHLGQETVTQENAPGVLDRLQGERKKLDAWMELIGSTPLAGDYVLAEPAKNTCRVLNGRSLDYPVPVRVVQARGNASNTGNAIEIQGSGLAGCGVVIANFIVMKAQGCGGTTPGRLMAVTSDRGIKDLTLYENVYGSTRDPGCLLGTLTRVEAPK
jgi:TPR repeat protein